VIEMVMKLVKQEDYRYCEDCDTVFDFWKFQSTICTINEPQEITTECDRVCCFTCSKFETCDNLCEDIIEGHTDKPATCCFAKEALKDAGHNGHKVRALTFSEFVEAVKLCREAGCFDS